MDSFPFLYNDLEGSSRTTVVLRGIFGDGAVVDPTRYTRGATIAGQPMTGLVDARKALALFDGGGLSSPRAEA